MDFIKYKSSLFTTSKNNKSLPTVDEEQEKVKSVVETLDSESTFLVDQVTQMRKRNGKNQFLLKWVGYSLKEATWEPIENLKGEACKPLLNVHTTAAGARMGLFFYNF
jgi:hypothetical protein